MDSHINLFRQTRATQSRAERGGFLATAAAPGRIANMIADLIAQEANMDRGVILPFAPRTAVPFMSVLPIGRQARR